MRRVAALATLVALAVLPACANLIDPAAAVVAGREITVEEIADAVEEFEASAQFERLADEGEAERAKREFEQNVLSRLIRRAVLAPKAAELGIEVTDADVDERIEEIKGDFGSEQEFEQAVSDQGFTMESLRELVRDGEVEQRIRVEVTKDVGPTEAEIREFYDANIDRFSQSRVAHILVNENGEAAEILEEIRAAPEGRVAQVFERLARQRSIDPGSAPQGGDLGFTSPGQLVPEFEQAMATLEEGEVSDVVRTQFGFHIIRLVERRSQPFEEARDEIEAELQGAELDETWNEWIIGAYEDADVELNPRYGELDLQTQQVRNAGPEEIPGAATPRVTPTETPEAPPAPQE